MTVSSLVAAFPETKGEITLFVSKMVESALDGYVNPLQMDAQLACMEKVVKDIRGNVEFKEAVLTEALKYNQKSFNEYNANYQIKEVGSKWHYEECGHEEYDRICTEIDLLTEKKKSFEKIMQNNKAEYVHTEMETGAMYTVKPPYKTSTTSVVTTIAK